LADKLSRSESFLSELNPLASSTLILSSVWQSKGQSIAGVCGKNSNGKLRGSRLDPTDPGSDSELFPALFTVPHTGGVRLLGNLEDGKVVLSFPTLRASKRNCLFFLPLLIGERPPSMELIA